jgi:hypothetical protein
MPYAALVTVVVVALVLGGLIARAVARGRAFERRGPRRVGLVPRPPAVKRVPVGTGTLEIDADLFERARLDDVPHPTTGVTALAPRGFSHVPEGPHVVRLTADNDSTKTQELRVFMSAGERVVIGRDGGGAPAVLARGPAPTSFDASYIHYPTWSRGVGLTILGRAVRARDPQGA